MGWGRNAPGATRRAAAPRPVRHGAYSIILALAAPSIVSVAFRYLTSLPKNSPQSDLATVRNQHSVKHAHKSVMPPAIARAGSELQTNNAAAPALGAARALGLGPAWRGREWWRQTLRGLADIVASLLDR